MSKDVILVTFSRRHPIPSQSPWTLPGHDWVHSSSAVGTGHGGREIVEANNEILSVIRSVAGNVGKYKRERNKALRAVVSEVYSAPRNTAAINLLPELRLVPGFALASPWNWKGMQMTMLEKVYLEVK